MPYHWLDFTPPQPQIAAAPVEDFVTAASTARHSFHQVRHRRTVLSGLGARHTVVDEFPCDRPTALTGDFP